MRRLTTALTSLALVAGFVLPASAGTLETSLDKVVRSNLPSAQPGEKLSVGVRIVRLGATPREDEVVYAKDDTTPLIPASNFKLLTVAVAQETLGKDFVFRTILAVRDTPSGVDVAVIGDGDPSFGDGEMLRPIDDWGVRTVFHTWANALSAAGISKVDRVLVDDGVFDLELLQPNWPRNQIHLKYVPEVAGLNLNLNVLDVFLENRGPGRTVRYTTDPPTAYASVDNTCKGGNRNAVWLTRRDGETGIILGGETNASRQGPMSVTMHDPALYFGTVLSETLAMKLSVAGKVERDRTIRQQLREQLVASSQGDGEPMTGGWRVVAIHETPLQTVLDRTNKDSENLYAEALAKRAAHAATGEPGSWAGHAENVKRYLAAIGSDADAVVVDDGCGLSRVDRVSAKVLTDVLADRFRSDAAAGYFRSLSEVGRDGTLKNRFDGQLDGRVFGKSGYINYVSTLSGYLKGRDGNWYAFSILINGCHNGAIWKAKQLQERVVLELDKSLPVTN